MSIIVKCYLQAENGVAAEWVLKSVNDTEGMPLGTINTLELHNAYHSYAELCMQWDRREFEAKNRAGRLLLKATMPKFGKGSLGFMVAFGAGH